jgi:diadenosine tetraphosphate (Ap4A) HIT family hydrolase
MKLPGCPLCEGPGGALVFQGPSFRLIRADEAGFPAFYRLVWNGHVAEFSDLSVPERTTCCEALANVELALREVLAPDKINLAALGNVVPHLHWHVIARFKDDSHFPAPVWAAPQREARPASLARIQDQLPALEALMVARLNALGNP